MSWVRGLLLVICVLVITSAKCGLRDDELLCEEAAAHLQECCPGFMPRAFDCARWAACGTTHSPDINLDTSACIASATCEQLQDQGTCARVTQATPGSSLNGVCQ